jgi:exodeoxyribonuclease VII large subunit
MSDTDQPVNTPQIWQVGQLCRAIAGVLGSSFNPVAVQGEISGFSRAASGHCYFSLKDETGQLRCAMFRRAASLLDFSPQDGELVELRGRLALYEPKGELQLVAESMSRAGQGVLFEQFLRLKAKLGAEGLFDASRKRILPTMPRGIGVVTSLGAAALHDVVATLQRRAPHVAVTVVAASVQGSQAPSELIHALSALYQQIRDGENHKSAAVPAEIILLVRGGGALEDLWAFNDEQLVRTIAQSPVPVICGVGHETDFTLCDFVADVRATTPTAAAELVAQPQAVSLQRLDTLLMQLKQAWIDFLDDHGQDLDGLQERLVRPLEVASRQKLKLASLAQRIDIAMRQTLRQQSKDLNTLQTVFPQRVRGALNWPRERLERAALRLGLLDPTLVLQRGYAWVSDATGATVTSASSLKAGQVLQLRLARGEAEVQVLNGQKKGRIERPLG